MRSATALRLLELSSVLEQGFLISEREAKKLQIRCIHVRQILCGNEVLFAQNDDRFVLQAELRLDSIENVGIHSFAESICMSVVRGDQRFAELVFRQLLLFLLLQNAVDQGGVFPAGCQVESPQDQCEIFSGHGLQFFSGVRHAEKQYRQWKAKKKKLLVLLMQRVTKSSDIWQLMRYSS